MDFELKFTSAEAGVKRSAQGFCAVLATAGMPPPLMERLESLSVFRHLFPAGQPGEERNPIAFSHLIVPVFGEPHHVVSRIQSAGLDYSKRFNYFAHHRAIDAGSLPPAGPAWVAGQDSVLQARWDGLVATPPACKPIPAGGVSPGVARHWQSVTGDAGWAGWILERWQANPDGEISVVFSPGDPTLELVQECVALLPVAARWRLTFSTFATKLPPDVACNLRFVAAGTPEANARNAVDLRSLRGQSPPDSPFVEAARQGREVPIKMPPSRSAATSSAAGYKLSNLGELPPLPTAQTSRPKYHAELGSLPSQSGRGRNIWIIGLLAAVMLGGAGYMFWDAQQKEAARIARAEINEKAKAEEDAERKKGERQADLKRQIDEKAESDRIAEKARLEKLERDRNESDRRKEETQKAKESTDKKATGTDAKTAEPKSSTDAAKSVSPRVEFLLKDAIKLPKASVENESSKPPVLFRTSKRIKVLKLFGPICDLPNIKLTANDGILKIDYVLQGEPTALASFSTDNDGVSLTWGKQGAPRDKILELLPECLLHVSQGDGSLFVPLRPKPESAPAIRLSSLVDGKEHVDFPASVQDFETWESRYIKRIVDPSKANKSVKLPDFVRYPYEQIGKESRSKWESAVFPGGSSPKPLRRLNLINASTLLEGGFAPQQSSEIHASKFRSTATLSKNVTWNLSLNMYRPGRDVNRSSFPLIAAFEPKLPIMYHAAREARKQFEDAVEVVAREAAAERQFSDQLFKAKGKEAKLELSIARDGAEKRLVEGKKESASKMNDLKRQITQMEKAKEVLEVRVEGSVYFEVMVNGQPIKIDVLEFGGSPKADTKKADR